MDDETLEWLEARFSRAGRHSDAERIAALTEALHLVAGSLASCPGCEPALLVGYPDRANPRRLVADLVHENDCLELRRLRADWS